MSKASTNDLSGGLIDLLDQFSPYVTAGVELSPTEVSNVVYALAIMHRIAVSLEAELNCHRLGEANRIASGIVENVSHETLGNLLIETDGNIIRPRFGREPKTP